MDMCDFSYRNETLSDHGYVLCDFDSGSSASPVTMDSQRTIYPIKMLNGKWYPFLFTTYDTALTISFYICKDDDDDIIVTPSEAATLKRWLCSPAAHTFKILNELYSDYHWYGTFNVEEMHSMGECVGFRLTFTSTSPFAYKDMVIVRGSVQADGKVTIEDTSDEEGYIYPDISVTVLEDGDLSISNSFDGRSTTVTDCTANETLTFTNLLQILSSDATRNVGDYFNYRFVRISNAYDLRTNQLTFSLPCNYTISYEPIAKVVFS